KPVTAPPLALGPVTAPPSVGGMWRAGRGESVTWRVGTPTGVPARHRDAGGMPHPLTPLPDTLPHAVFTTAEALTLGVGRARLRRADLLPVSPGLWARRDREVTEREIVAALCRAQPGAFAAGLTAARMWGFPLPGDVAQEVTSPPGPPRAVD